MLQDENHSDEGGFSLVEVVVSMLIFALFTTALAGLIIKTTQTSAQASQRQAAANLAERQKEYLLGLSYADVLKEPTKAITSGGITYSITSNVTLVPDNDKGDACSATSGTSLTTKRIDVTVTWPNMGTVPPVRNVTTRPIPAKESGNALGTVAWQILDQYGKGLPGISGAMYATGAGGALLASTTTDGNGCLIFSDLEDGTAVSLVVDTAGYVGKNNKQLQSVTATAAAGKLVVSTATSYAPAASMQLTAKTVTNHPLQSGVSVGSVLYADAVSGYAQRPACGTGQTPAADACQSGTGVVAGLYPRGYATYLGRCADVRANTSDLTPKNDGTVPAYDVQLGAAWVAVQRGTFPPTSTLKVSAVHDSLGNGSCSTDELPVTVTVGNLAGAKFALPLGTWKIRVTDPSTGKYYDQALPTVTTTAPALATTVLPTAAGTK